MKRYFLITALFWLLRSCDAQNPCPAGNPINLGNCSNPVSAILLTPNPASVAVGNTLQLAVSAQLTNPPTIANLITSQCTNWTTSDATLATVNSSGVVTGVAAGSPTISCTAGITNVSAGITGSVVVTVGAIPAFQNPQAAGCANPCPITPGGTNGIVYSFLLAATGGTAPYTFTNSAGSPPTGLSLTSTGCGTNVGCNIAGTPSVNGTVTWTLQVADSASHTNTLVVSLTISAAPACGTPPNYCARIDTAVVSGSTVNSGNPPTSLIGLNGAGNCVTDDMNSGPAAATNLRVSDYSMVVAQLPASVHYFTTPSSSTQRSGNSDSTKFYVVDTGNGMDFFSYTKANPCNTMTAFLGRATADTNGINFNGAAEWSANLPLTFYSDGATGAPNRVTLNKTVQDGTTGAGSFVAAHLTSTVLADPINAPGLTAYGAGPNGNWWNRYLAKTGADISADTADHVQAFDYRYVQDKSTIIIVHDSTQSGVGIRWLNVQTGQIGGSYGPTGATTGFGPLPAPAAPTVALSTSGGSLDCTRFYRVAITYTTIGNNNNFGGESTKSLTSSAAPNGAGSTCSLAITPPVANPGGGTGINLTMSATGFNYYVCSDTGPPAALCTVFGQQTLQTNGTNSSGVLSQPVISGVTCTGSAGSTSYTFYVVAKNSGGTSIPSAGFTVTNQDPASPKCTVSYAAVTNATSYDVLVDYLNVICGSSTTTSFLCNTPVGPTTNYVIQSNPIATTPVITSLSTTGPTPPTVNSAGVLLHNIRMEQGGQWIVMSVSDSLQSLQGSPVKAPMQLLWHVGTTKLIPASSGVQSAPYLSYGAAHWTHQPGQMVTWPAFNLKAEAVVTTFNDDVNVMNAGQTFLNVANGALDTQSGDQHLSGNFTGAVTKDAYSTTNAYVLPTVPYNGEIDAWNMTNGNLYRFCHTWDSGQEGFNSTPRGNESQDGTYIVYTSDDLRNGNGSQGTAAVGLGNTSGGSTCTLGPSGTCRYDIFLCQLK
jgi:hypothetical protein